VLKEVPDTRRADDLTRLNLQADVSECSHGAVFVLHGRLLAVGRADITHC
jgi:hypothetical protein